ncbi:MAG: superoxide dismutase family protein [Chloroflexi bacterium]|nr:superoxide dismutase family protein [Chloroflexota bacterium]
MGLRPLRAVAAPGALWIGALALLAAAACSDDGAPGAVGATARAALAAPNGDGMGAATLTQTPTGVLITAEVRGLSPGAHGFHIHGTGACAPDFTAAGSHFAPGGEPHGFLHEDGPHAGDLPNIHVGEDGTGRADYFTAAVTLAAGADHSLFDADGSAFIVHADPDDYLDVASAGARIACGVIERG